MPISNLISWWQLFSDFSRIVRLRFLIIEIVTNNLLSIVCQCLIFRFRSVFFICMFAKSRPCCFFSFFYLLVCSWSNGSVNWISLEANANERSRAQNTCVCVNITTLWWLIVFGVFSLSLHAIFIQVLSKLLSFEQKFTFDSTHYWFTIYDLRW